jgi:hypothetical protein
MRVSPYAICIACQVGKIQGGRVKADVGDWLLINSHSEGRPSRRALILAVGTDGAAPYTVRWTDTDHEGLVFPGPDAEVVSAARLAEIDRAQAERGDRLQSAISQHSNTIHPGGSSSP